VSREHLDRSPTPAIVAQVLGDVAEHWGLALHNLDGGRAPAQVDIRAIAQWYFHERYGYGYSEVGRMFKKDHATVLHNVRRIAHFVRLQDDGQANRLGGIARKLFAGGRLAAE
jgi:chromosomal replication initiation ATPase DnaA